MHATYQVDPGTLQEVMHISPQPKFVLCTHSVPYIVIDTHKWPGKLDIAVQMGKPIDQKINLDVSSSLQQELTRNLFIQMSICY